MESGIHPEQEMTALQARNSTGALLTEILLATQITSTNTFFNCYLAIDYLPAVRQDGIHRKALKSLKEYKETHLGLF